MAYGQNAPSCDPLTGSDLQMRFENFQLLYNAQYKFS